MRCSRRTRVRSCGTLFCIAALFLALELPDAANAPPLIAPLPQRRTVDAPPERVSFYLVWTKDAASWVWLFQAALESVLRAHPTARVTVLSPTLPLDHFACFVAAGYTVSVERYDIATLARGTPAEALAAPGGPLSQSHFRYVHESDLARILVLLTRGGTYVDTDMLFLRPLDEEVLEVAGVGLETVVNKGRFHDAGTPRINNAVLHFPYPHHPLLTCMVTQIASSFQPGEWACIGPDLLARCKKMIEGTPGSALRVHARTAFYPMDWQHAWHIASNASHSTDPELFVPDAVETLTVLWPSGEWLDSYAVHLYTSRMDYGLTNGSRNSSFMDERGPRRGSALEGLIARYARLPGLNCPARSVIEDEPRLLLPAWLDEFSWEARK